MVKMCELSLAERQRMVGDISHIMSYNFRIDKDSINEFWDIVEIGIEMKKRA